MKRVATIGVYGFSGPEFLDALRAADVRLLLDVRQRRGVRGSEYAWANSRRLQAALADAGIAYEHWAALAPTPQPRHLPQRADDRAAPAAVRGGRAPGRRRAVADLARAGVCRALCAGDPRRRGSRGAG